MSVYGYTNGSDCGAIGAPAADEPETFRCDECGDVHPVVLVASWLRDWYPDGAPYPAEPTLRTVQYYEDDNQHAVYGPWSAAARSYPQRHVCTKCRDEQYTYCEDMEDWHSSHDCVESSDGEWATSRYARSNWHYCEHNETWYRDESDYQDVMAEYAEPEENDSGCYNYGTNVIGVHGWPRATKRDELCFGVELEMEPKERDRDGQRAISEALGGRDGNGRYILAEDGSLDYGVEVISLPYTLAEHSKGMWREIASKVSDIAMSGSGTTNCGLHVHINRKPLSPLTVGKMLVFINSERTAHLVTTVAQRTGASWARRVPKKFSDGRRPQPGGHYDALGITEHGTLELRIFRGNLRPERILKALEFAHALVYFCQGASMLDVENPRNFVTYVRQNKKLYPNLCAFIQEAQGYGRAAAERITSGRNQARTEA